MRIEKEAAELTIAVVDALRQANQAATNASALIKGAIGDLEDAAAKATAGDVITVGNDKFTMKPDIPTITAATTVGVMADVTKDGLKSAAIASSDDVARNISRGLGPFGAAIGTVPAIIADIDGGMDADKAIVSEGVGAGLGLAVGTAAGSWASGAVAGATFGSVVPGAGTAAGLVVGAALGGGTSYLAAKGIQWAWWD